MVTLTRKKNTIKILANLYKFATSHSRHLVSINAIYLALSKNTHLFNVNKGFILAISLDGSMSGSQFIQRLLDSLSFYAVETGCKQRDVLFSKFSLF